MNTHKLAPGAVIAAIGICMLFAGNSSAGEPKAVPKLQVIPLPYDQASFQRNGVELTRYHFSPSVHRPFLYPVNGPSGWSLTRMGHPHDPESHSHHNSVWTSHHDVAGVNFWSDGGKGTIRHKRIAKYADGGQCSQIVAENEWVDGDDRVLLDETRKIAVVLLDQSEWLAVIDIQLAARGQTVTLGKTPFGVIGVRMAKTIGVHDGAGTIRNSEGGVDEKEVFWKRARWVDYSGPVKKRTHIEGVTLFDHPDNLNHPAHFHVRNDGWMGASLCFEGPRDIEPDKPLSLRYGLYVHADMPETEAIDAQWKKFAKLDPDKLLEK